MNDTKSKVAIVTGASRGIGSAVAERLAGEGFYVVINYSGEAASAGALAHKIEGKGGRALAIKADVSASKDVRRARALPVGRIGRPDEVAAAVLLLMSNGFVTGTVLAIDGGGSLV